MNLAITKLHFPNNVILDNPIVVDLYIRTYYGGTFTLIQSNVDVNPDGTINESPLPTTVIDPQLRYLLKAVDLQCGDEYIQMVPPDPNIGSYIYFGAKATGAYPTESEILAGQTTIQDPNNTIAIDWTIFNASPAFCWFALLSPATKSAWEVEPPNGGNIGGPTDLFGSYTVVSVQGNNYNVYITNYATQFAGVCTLT